MRSFRWIVALLVLGFAGEARATPAFAFKIGAGVNFPAGAANGPLATGGTFIVGGGLQLHPRVDVLLDYIYAGNALDTNAFRNQAITGLHSMHIFEATGRFAVYNSAPVSVGLLLWPGVYYRRVSIDQVVGTGVSTFCSPFLFYCAPAAVPITQEIGTRSAWDFGLAAGADVGMVSEGVSPYLEVRVERVFGGTVTDAAGVQHSTSATFIPISVGIRYQ